ncbi:MAG: helix-turn-helix transcriptional regulator [Acetivibrio sp.]
MVYDFGIRLKELRKDKHLSQSDAAKRLGITRSTVSAYECNTKTPSVEVLLQLAVLYNSSLDYMMGFENRSSIYLDDMTESQQKTILDIIDRLKQEFNQNK